MKFAEKTKKKNYFSFSNSSQNHSLYEIMWGKYGRDGQATDNNIIGRMPFACYIPKATNTRSEYVMLIAFTLQQWLHNIVSALRYTCTSSVVRLRLKCDGTRAETRFRLSAKRTIPFKSAGGVSVKSTTCSRGVRISGSNAGYAMFRGSVKCSVYPLHSPVSPSLPLPVRHRVPSHFNWTLPPYTSRDALSLVPVTHQRHPLCRPPPSSSKQCTHSTSRLCHT